MLTISGIMSGAWLSGRLAGKIPPKQQIRHGFVIMFVTSVLNLVANLFSPPMCRGPCFRLRCLPLAGR